MCIQGDYHKTTVGRPVMARRHFTVTRSGILRPQFNWYGKLKQYKPPAPGKRPRYKTPDDPCQNKDYGFHAHADHVLKGSDRTHFRVRLHGTIVHNWYPSAQGAPVGYRSTGMTILSLVIPPHRRKPTDLDRRVARRYHIKIERG